ncbi:hypothetical protein ACFX2I_025095 [Malus domestica]
MEGFVRRWRSAELHHSLTAASPSSSNWHNGKVAIFRLRALDKWDSVVAFQAPQLQVPHHNGATAVVSFGAMFSLQT